MRIARPDRIRFTLKTPHLHREVEELFGFFDRFGGHAFVHKLDTGAKKFIADKAEDPVASGSSAFCIGISFRKGRVVPGRDSVVTDPHDK